MTELIKQAIESFGYVGILVFSFLENIFPPIPSEIILPLGGFLAAGGKITFVGAILAGTVGAMLGALPLYYLGKVLGEQRIRQFVDRYGKWLGVSGKDMDKAHAWLGKHGTKAVFLCRLVPGVRSLISIPAGFCNMGLPAFLLFSTAGTAIWTTLLVSVGWLLGENYAVVEKYIDPISKVVLVLIIVVPAAWLVRRFIRLRRQTQTA